MTHDSLISIWGSRAALARAIGESEITVRHWFRRGSIPVRYDRQIIEAAAKAGHTITHDDMFALREDLSRSIRDVA